MDKTNYNAFVFVGVASIELGKAEHAQAAYKKAIDINSDNILAWQVILLTNNETFLHHLSEGQKL